MGASGTNTGLHKPTLLCVDDNETALNVRKMVLESAGYTVLVASDSATAMEVFSSSAVDMVVSDHLLQGCTGIELAAAMKKLKPDVPMVIISGLVDAPEGIEHADLFICKGDSPPQVLQKISDLLEKSRCQASPSKKYELAEAFEMAAEASGDSKFELRLYVAGETPKSLRAIANVRRICEEHLAGQYELEVVDLSQNPVLAKGEQIVAVPTLIKKLPIPLRKLIGDMADADSILVGLGLATKTI
jgi:circadian clock protein KaiB